MGNKSLILGETPNTFWSLQKDKSYLLGSFASAMITQASGFRFHRALQSSNMAMGNPWLLLEYQRNCFEIGDFPRCFFYGEYIIYRSQKTQPYGIIWVGLSPNIGIPFHTIGPWSLRSFSLFIEMVPTEIDKLNPCCWWDISHDIPGKWYVYICIYVIVINCVYIYTHYIDNYRYSRS